MWKFDYHSFWYKKNIFSGLANNWKNHAWIWEPGTNDSVGVKHPDTDETIDVVDRIGL